MVIFCVFQYVPFCAPMRSIGRSLVCYHIFHVPMHSVGDLFSVSICSVLCSHAFPRAMSCVFPYVSCFVHMHTLGRSLLCSHTLRFVFPCVPWGDLVCVPIRSVLRSHVLPRAIPCVFPYTFRFLLPCVVFCQ